MKVDAVPVGQIFRGELQTGKSGRLGFDLAGYAEVHCDGYDDCTSFTSTVNPRGRSWYTHHLAVHAGERLQGVPRFTPLRTRMVA